MSEYPMQQSDAVMKGCGYGASDEVFFDDFMIDGHNSAGARVAEGSLLKQSSLATHLASASSGSTMHHSVNNPVNVALQINSQSYPAQDMPKVDQLSTSLKEFHVAA